ncbi:MAG: 3-hydroxyacyl-CoA dehydrogenase [Rhodospirillaceae bacterium]|nr:3-hydroxyacyl-CoA dehydrogenase [Rhodospirillaceae bacterium]
MGSAIAAHIANAGVAVDLLDIVPDGAGDRSRLAKGALARLLKTDPAPFMTRRAARLVTPGNIEDDLDRIAASDWVIEAIVEDAGIKARLYDRIVPHLKPDAILSSNTSTLRLADLTAGRPADLRRRFVITHFFNPPRYMRLMELVAAPDADAGLIEALTRFCDIRLGKSVVRAKDTPGFIANRIGAFWVQSAVNDAFDQGIGVEAADAVIGPPMGIPKTGVFGLLDLVGLDLMPHIAKGLRDSLPAGDPFHAVDRRHPLIDRLIADGYTGRKGKGGFYRLNRTGGAKVKEAVNLATGAFAPAVKQRLDSIAAAKDGGLRALLTHDDATGRYAWSVLSATLAYAAQLVPEVADDIVAVDTAMRLGYAWTYGPFQLIDRLGAGWFADRLGAEGRTVPPLLALAAEAGGFYREEADRLAYLDTNGSYKALERPPGVLLLADIKRGAKPLLRNGSASLWDIGDGVTCFEFTSKMNTIDEQILALLGQSIDLTAQTAKAMVVYNEGDNFSVGANIGVALFLANIAAWDQLEDAIRTGQTLYKTLKYAPIPVVGAPSGMALGGGLEVLLHSDAVQAHAETYAGLVEAGVGIIPAWGGSKEYLLRQLANPRRPGGPMPAINQAFQTIATATVAKSAAEAQEMLFFRRGDGITMNRDRLLADAKAKALDLARDYRPPAPQDGVRLPGPTAAEAMKLAIDAFRLLGKATPHDAVVATALARVLSGGDTDWTGEVGEDDLLTLERAAFVALIRTPETLARMEHMLTTGKPLRN